MKIFRLCLALLLICSFLLRIWTRFFMQKRLIDRARTWPVVEGTLDEGGVRSITKDKSAKVTGHEALFAYEYYDSAGHEGIGVYAMTCTSSQEEQSIVNLLAHKKIPAHVDPARPDKSLVLDEDLKTFLPVGQSLN